MVANDTGLGLEGDGVVALLYMLCRLLVWIRHHIMHFGF